MITYHPTQQNLVEEVRGFLNKNQTAIINLPKKVKSAKIQKWFALLAEFFVFFSVMLWSAYKPVGTNADGESIWGYSTIGIVMAIFVSVLAPICTAVSAPLRDAAGKIRSVAILAWFGMSLVWFPSVMEFVSQTSLKVRVVNEFGIESDWQWIVSAILFILGIALFSVFNHIYRDAKEKEKTHADDTDAIYEAIHLNETVTHLEEGTNTAKQLTLDHTEWKTLSAKVDSHSMHGMANAMHHADLTKAHQALVKNPPDTHSSKQTRLEHEQKVQAIEALLTKSTTNPKELS